MTSCNKREAVLVVVPSWRQPAARFERGRVKEMLVVQPASPRLFLSQIWPLATSTTARQPAQPPFVAAGCQLFTAGTARPVGHLYSLTLHLEIRIKSQTVDVRRHRPILHTLPTRHSLLPSVLSSSSTCHSLLPYVISSSVCYRRSILGSGPGVGIRWAGWNARGVPTVPRQPTATPSVLTRSHHHRRSSQAQHAAPRVASPAPSRQPASHASREHQYALNLAPEATAQGCQQQRTHSALNTPCPRDL
ncbi:hypothetical protein WN944_025708 [Citrus x changshan-huyou]|uniref:Uncharacterized protein n=1 Tax=Citrus x changshan-huyou TaxID=2935761 RepID=A0AAP0LT16_9ROSI